MSNRLLKRRQRTEAQTRGEQHSRTPTRKQTHTRAHTPTHVSAHKDAHSQGGFTQCKFLAQLLARELAWSFTQDTTFSVASDKHSGARLSRNYVTRSALDLHSIVLGGCEFVARNSRGRLYKATWIESKLQQSCWSMLSGRKKSCWVREWIDRPT